MTTIRLARAMGLGPGQARCATVIFERESGFRADVWNHQGSGAYGIPQALPARKMASAGGDWRTNPATQIVWGLDYMRGRYGSPCGALAHWNARRWY